LPCRCLPSTATIAAFAGRKTNYLLNIKDNVERMTQMIDDILVIGKIEAKVLQVNPEPLDVVAFCQTLLEEREYRRPKAPLNLSAAVANSSPMGMNGYCALF
jgi:signal transduction histidine kinase